MELEKRQCILRAHTLSVNCQWMRQSLGCCANDDDETSSSFSLHSAIDRQTLGCLSGSIVACIRAAEFVQVHQINACALAFSSLFHSEAAGPPSLQATAALFHRYGVPGKHSQTPHRTLQSHCVDNAHHLCLFSAVCWESASMLGQPQSTRFLVGIHGGKVHFVLGYYSTDLKRSACVDWHKKLQHLKVFSGCSNERFDAL
jgi:hypothetical protein